MGWPAAQGGWALGPTHTSCHLAPASPPAGASAGQRLRTRHKHSPLLAVAFSVCPERTMNTLPIWQLVRVPSFLHSRTPGSGCQVDRKVSAPQH